MLEMYKKRLGFQGANIGQVMKKQSDMIMNESFKRDVDYRRAKLYDQNHNFLEEVDIKFKKNLNYSIAKDAVDFLVQFRPLYHPEKKYTLYPSDIDENGKAIVERLGFYLDIPDDTGDINTWLIVGKSDNNQFVTYNVLKCNWTCRWIKDRVIYECLGCIRSRNNYNSGEWSDGFVTSVENQAAIWLPTNDKTQTITYNDRFLLSDRTINPLAFHVSKVEDLYPLGVTKFTLSQNHFDPIKDNAELRLADYYASEITPTVEEEVVIPEEEVEIAYSKISLNSAKYTLPLGASKKTLEVSYFNKENEVVENSETLWTLTGKQDGKLYSDEEVRAFLDIDIEASNTGLLSVKIPKDNSTYGLIGTVITFTANKGEITESSIQLEVTSR